MRRKEKEGKHKQNTRSHIHPADSWRMRTMSLLSLNGIYKPNRHTPTPLTQTHSIAFVTRLFSLSVKPAHTSSALLCADFINSPPQKLREIPCDGEKTWVQAVLVGDRIDRGNILFLLCVLWLSDCSHWGRVSVMIQGPWSLSKEAENRTWPLWHSLNLSSKNKHTGDRDRVDQKLYSPLPCALLQHFARLWILPEPFKICPITTTNFRELY